MKWWNKKRGRDNWTKVTVPLRVWTQAYNRDKTDLQQWCKRQPSKGRFYYLYDDWYFEKSEDATYFLLKWA
jgi:hypothetical protein